MVVAAAPELVGRAEELDRLRAISTLTDGPRAALIRGEPGMGKTSLWEAATYAAAEAGVCVLTARCVRAEMPLAFAVLYDLAEAVLREVSGRLATPQLRALEAALGGDESQSGDAVVLPRAVLDCLRLVSEAGPVVVAVDDVQWIDRPSARVLAFALRRLGDRPVAALATLRGGHEAIDPLRLAEAYGGRLMHLDLAPLSAGALQRVLRLRLGVRLPRPIQARIQQASGGNPMFALEFGRAFAGSGRSEPLAIPASLEELVHGRVERLSMRVRPLLELVAVLERPTITVLGQGLGGEAQALKLIEAAGDANALVVDEEDVVRFSHPLLGSAVYGRLTVPARRQLHRRAAELVEELEPRARHLALGCGGPDARVAALLDEAAAAAARRGAPDSAAELLEQARFLSPDRDRAARRKRTLTLAHRLAESSQTVRAAAVLDELLGEGVPDPLRAEALIVRATVEYDARRSADFFREALQYCGDNRPLRVRVLLSLAEAHAQWLGDLAQAEAYVLEARDCDEAVATGLHALILKWMGRIAALRGLPERELTWAAVELERGRSPPLGQSGARCALAQQLAWAGELEAARALAEEHLSDLARRGHEFDRAWQLPILAEIELRQGEFGLARVHAAEVEELFDPADAWGQATARALRAAVAVHTGAVVEGRRLTLDVLAHAERANLHLNSVRYRWLLGHLELSLGNPGEARHWLADLPDELETMGIREPAFVPVLPDAIETLVELGETAQADVLLARLESQATALEHRWAIPAARRSRALLLLAAGETVTAVIEAERAAAAFERSGFPVEQARAFLVAGQALRRGRERRRAQAALSEAGEILERVGAMLWHERVRQELRRANPRPRRDGDLTRSERRVAELVAEGKTNREVAAQLYVTVSTVEAHLTRIYRKVDVRSRAELARRVASGAVTVQDD